MSHSGSHVELGDAEGLWEALRQGDFDTCDNDFDRRLPCGVVFFCAASVIWQRHREECWLY